MLGRPFLFNFLRPPLFDVVSRCFGLFLWHTLLSMLLSSNSRGAGVYLATTVLASLLLLRHYASPNGLFSLVPNSRLWLPSSSRPQAGELKLSAKSYSRQLVIGHQSQDDMSWLEKELPDVNKTLYNVDDWDATPRVPQNKGREAMVYLTYIIDHYESLPDVVLFFHPHQHAWHNNILLDLNTALTIRRLGDARVVEKGYMNSRCHHDPGCPDWLHLDRPKEELDFIRKKEEEYFTADVWHDLHPGAPPEPPAISQPCCAQFAVSGERIRSRPLSDYIHYRTWLLDTTLADSISGRIMEYTWQYIFTGESEFCPSQDECYCDGYGICFGGDNQLQDWLNVLRQREIADEELGKLAEDKSSDEATVHEYLRKREEINKTVEQMKHEAYERGDRMREQQAQGSLSR